MKSSESIFIAKCGCTNKVKVVVSTRTKANGTNLEIG